MSIIDANINWKFGSRYFPVHLFNGRNPLDHFTTGGAGTSNVSLGTGVPPVIEVSAALELTGLEMTAGDMIHTIIPLLDLDVDRNKEMEFRVFWIDEDADADTGIVWKLHYAFVAPGGAVGDAVVDADEVAITAVSTAAGAVALSAEVSLWGRMDIAASITSTDMLMNVALELDSEGTVDTDDTFCLGMELRWTRETTTQKRQITA